MSNYDLRNRHNLTSAERKQMPIHRGCSKYFPDALMLVAMLSLRADRKHTPNADLNDLSRPQWAQGKSPDHGDCIERHQLDVGTIDPEMGLDYAIHVAWRALAQLQTAVNTRGIDQLVDWDWTNEAHKATTEEEHVSHNSIPNQNEEKYTDPRIQ